LCFTAYTLPVLLSPGQLERSSVLARLKGGLLGPGCALEVHAEPEDRNR